jgi:DNA-binding NarL/FixJ family response regulator
MSSAADTATPASSAVRTHISRSVGKLGARDRAQLVGFAVRVGLAIPEQ